MANFPRRSGVEGEVENKDEGGKEEEVGGEGWILKHDKRNTLLTHHFLLQENNLFVSFPYRTSLD
jgi:hypothetical protein